MLKFLRNLPNPNPKAEKTDTYKKNENLIKKKPKKKFFKLKKFETP